MTIFDKTGDRKLQYNINKAAKKHQRYHLEKIDKYEYLTDEEILPSIKGK